MVQGTKTVCLLAMDSVEYCTPKNVRAEKCSRILRKKNHVEIFSRTRRCAKIFRSRTFSPKEIFTARRVTLLKIYSLKLSPSCFLFWWNASPRFAPFRCQMAMLCCVVVPLRATLRQWPPNATNSLTTTKEIRQDSAADRQRCDSLMASLRLLRRICCSGERRTSQSPLCKPAGDRAPSGQGVLSAGLKSSWAQKIHAANKNRAEHFRALARARNERTFFCRELFLVP